jgi:amidophosphoribosyltransferase
MTSEGINSSELVSAMIDQKSSFAEGIRFAQDVIDGTASILILKDDGKLIAARDKVGRIPVLIGKREAGFCVSFEDFAYKKLGFEDYKELGPGEIVEVSADGVKVLAPARKEKKICAFLWSYYGYPTSCYEGRNVEAMRYENGKIMAQTDKLLGEAQNIDYVSGVPDSGTPHAIGYANESAIPFARPYIKYTPTWSRSFMPNSQADRKKVAKMKQIPVHELIKDKNLLFVDDSIVRGTQLKETVDFLSQNGARAIHMRSACPPIMYSCKYLNFTRSTGEMELLARRIVMELEGEEGFSHLEEYSDSNTERGKKLRAAICEKLHFDSVEFQSLEGIIKAIGIEPCKLCTYCWNGKE